MLSTGHRIHRKQGDILMSRQPIACIKKYSTWPTEEHRRIAEEIVWSVQRIEHPGSLHVWGIELRGSRCTPRYRCRYPRGRCRRSATVSLVIRYGKWKGRWKTLSVSIELSANNKEIAHHIWFYASRRQPFAPNTKNAQRKENDYKLDLFTDKEPLSQADQVRVWLLMLKKWAIHAFCSAFLRQRDW